MASRKESVVSASSPLDSPVKQIQIDGLSCCEHIHVATIRCFLNGCFLILVYFIERKACSTYSSKRRYQQRLNVR
ncbi:hypothetical protein DPX16_1958 [Anabarilius grahami]|uniref:Uncharacterized protein n=1 Tax=Anabarilius grahami TaxID=495550 RepID=A0A3N0YJJ2_ANAGA|nr:hypothetical protein DPX16_1958 [Anabarilius grahami]